MPQFPQSLPSENSISGKLARQLSKLLGPAYQPKDQSIVAARLLALSDSLADTRSKEKESIDQAFVSSATSLLTALEALYDLPNGNGYLTTQERQIRLTTLTNGNRAGTPNSIVQAIQKTDPTAQIYENTSAPTGFDEALFRFAVTITESIWGNPTYRNYLQFIIDKMKPAHTRGFLAVNANFLTDDPNSLVDRDVLGI